MADNNVTSSSKALTNDSSTLSYKELRAIVGVLAFTLPIILLIGDNIIDGSVFTRPSISAYFYTAMQPVFVGVLFVTGVFLFTYRPDGYYPDGNIDSILGDFACVFAIGIALFPTTPEPPQNLEYCINALGICLSEATIGIVHYASAGLFFLSLIIFAGFLFTKFSTPRNIWSYEKMWRKRIYKITAVVMASCIILIGVGGLFKIKSIKITMGIDIYPVFWLETIALWAFGISWFVKSKIFLLKDK